MAKRADGCVEAPFSFRYKLVSQVVDDASDRAAWNGRWDGQVLLREEPNVDALLAGVRGISIAPVRHNVAHDRTVTVIGRFADVGNLARPALTKWPERTYRTAGPGCG